MALNQVDEPSNMALYSPDEPLRGRAARDHGLQFKDRSFATGNMPCEVVDFEVGLVGQTPHHGTGTDGATPSGNTGTHGHTVTHRRSTSQPSGNHPNRTNAPTQPRDDRESVADPGGAGSRDTPPVCRYMYRYGFGWLFSPRLGGILNVALMLKRFKRGTTDATPPHPGPRAAPPRRPRHHRFAFH